jgi:hypothetical protein
MTSMRWTATIDEGAPDRHPGLHVHLLASPLGSAALVRDAVTAPATRTDAKVEADGRRLVLLHRRAPTEPFRFVRALGAPSRAQVEETAAERFPAGCRLTIAWLVDSPILFVVAWDDERCEALPLGGGRAAWVPLHDHLSRLRTAASD